MYVLPIDYSTDYAYFSYAGTWGSASPPVTAINSFPAGLQITVDGGPPNGSVCTAPCTFQDGLSHTIAVASPQQRSGDPAGVQYQFASWSDGGAQSHTIQPGASVTANFNTWYQLTTGSSTGGGSVVVGALSGTVVAPLTPTQLAAGWYPAGTSFWVTGLATQGYAFINLSNGLTQQYVVLNGPMTVTANFTNNVITLQSSTQVVVPNNGKRITAQYAVTSGDASLLSACTSNDPYLYGTIDGVTGGTIEISYGDNGGEPGSDPITCYCSFGYCAVAFVAPIEVVETPIVTLLVNGTVETSDDITVLNPVQTIPIQVALAGPSGTTQSVNLSVTPAGRASLDQTSLTLTVGQPVTVTLTPLAVSQAANDVQITAMYQQVTLGQASLTIVNVVIPTVTSYAATPTGVPYHVPPGVSVQVPITVQPDLAGSGQSVTLAALGTTSSNNGSFTIDGGATETVVSSKTVNVTGETQTAQSAAPGGAYAGNLTIAAQVRGQSTVQSNGFSVAALPGGVLATYDDADPAFPTWDGLVAVVTVSSDSGSIGDLDQVKFGEILGMTVQTGSLSGCVLGSPGPYAAAIPGQYDEHSINVTCATSQTPGSMTVNQIFAFNDLRTGAYNVPISNSGYVIVHEMDCPPPPGFVTTYACSITTSVTGAGVSVGNNPLVLAGATSPSPMSLTQPVEN